LIAMTAGKANPDRTKNLVNGAARSVWGARSATLVVKDIGGKNIKRPMQQCAKEVSERDSEKRGQFPGGGWEKD